jgi:hypothetical protein
MGPTVFDAVLLFLGSMVLIFKNGKSPTHLLFSSHAPARHPPTPRWRRASVRRAPHRLLPMAATQPPGAQSRLGSQWRPESNLCSAGGITFLASLQLPLALSCGALCHGQVFAGHRTPASAGRGTTAASMHSRRTHAGGRTEARLRPRRAHLSHAHTPYCQGTEVQPPP